MSFEMLRNGESDIIKGHDTIHATKIDLQTISTWSCDVYCSHCDETFEHELWEDDCTVECPYCGAIIDVIFD